MISPGGTLIGPYDDNPVGFYENPDLFENADFDDNEGDGYDENFDDNPDMFDNPFEGLMSNQGPFSRAALTGYFVAAGGVGFGFIIADMLDRYVATRKPADSMAAAGGTAAAGQRPWYGRNAAAAQRRRPDGIRLGSQAIGALVAMAGAYFTRNMRILPWLLGGAAVGFGANLFKMLWDWWVAPAMLKVDPAKPLSFANRIYPLEQRDVQDTIDGYFEQWSNLPALAGNQTAAEPTSIPGPLASQAPAADMYALGRAGQPGIVQYARPPQPARRPCGVGQPEFTPTGRVGNCALCGGMGGCYCGCPYLSEITAGAPPGVQACQVTWPAGLAVADVVAQTGVAMEVIVAMNPGVSIAPGATVNLPLAACTFVRGFAPSPLVVQPGVLAPVPGVLTPGLGPLTVPGGAAFGGRMVPLQGPPENLGPPVSNGNGNGHSQVGSPGNGGADPDAASRMVLGDLG
jgi:hypothetical protein